MLEVINSSAMAVNKNQLKRSRKMGNIDWKRFSNGSKQINVEGIAYSEDRKKMVGQAIGLIMQDPKTALKNEYLGYKNYEAFGDQRCDCSYGTGPRHGSIVFSIGRSSSYDESSNHADTIYFLKCFRDSIGLARQSERDRYITITDNIQNVFNRMVRFKEEAAKLQEFLNGLSVDENDSEIISRAGI